MIKYIKGYYAMTFAGGIVIETPSGIGFEINIPAGSPLYKYGEGEEITVFTAMIVKEDDISLYGFHNRESLDLFRMLITVSGIGAKGAMSIMEWAKKLRRDSYLSLKIKWARWGLQPALPMLQMDWLIPRQLWEQK